MAKEAKISILNLAQYILSKVATIGVNECATLGMGDEVLERIIEKDNKFRKLHLAWIKKFRTLIA